MGWFAKKRGADMNVLRKTMYWYHITQMIETDSKTQKLLVQYVYEQVSDALILELERAKENLPGADDEVHQYLHNRIILLKKYREIAYKSEGKANG